MPITFGSLEELKEFMQAFQFQSGGNGSKKSTSVMEAPPQNTVSLAEVPAHEPKKRGRKPGSVSAKATVGKMVRTPEKPKKSAESSKLVKLPKAAKVAKVVSAKAPSKPGKTKGTATTEKKSSRGEGTLTGKIQTVIQELISNRQSFTANDIYAILSEKDTTVNKQSVITSVLKQMNTTFEKIKVSERPGNGPRPVKVYLP
ncbi:MAG: hypothetical protein SFZ03_04695 [Candidatus Melainabacteria bacterium]|nr:hypothetical protein [Candidatus Melainabacteria bacterium]